MSRGRKVWLDMIAEVVGVVTRMRMEGDEVKDYASVADKQSCRSLKGLTRWAIHLVIRITHT